MLRMVPPPKKKILRTSGVGSRNLHFSQALPVIPLGVLGPHGSKITSPQSLRALPALKCEELLMQPFPGFLRSFQGHERHPYPCLSVHVFL